MQPIVFIAIFDHLFIVFSNPNSYRDLMLISVPYLFLPTLILIN
jgi:hypothetical protein